MTFSHFLFTDLEYKLCILILCYHSNYVLDQVKTEGGKSGPKCYIAAVKIKK